MERLQGCKRGVGNIFKGKKARFAVGGKDEVFTNNSGEDVAKETTVIPTTSVEILILRAKETELLTRISPPKNNITKLKRKKVKE